MQAPNITKIQTIRDKSIFGFHSVGIQTILMRYPYGSVLITPAVFDLFDNKHF